MALISSFNYIYVDFVCIMVISILFTFMVITYLFTFMVITYLFLLF